MSFHLKLNFLVQIFGGVVRFDLDSDGFEEPLRGRGQFSVRILVLWRVKMTLTYRRVVVRLGTSDDFPFAFSPNLVSYGKLLQLDSN